MNTTNAESVLTEAQWQGLAQVGELAQTVKSLLDGPLGGVVTELLVRGTDLVPQSGLEALQHALGILGEWHDNGTLDQLASLVGLMSSMVTPENIQLALDTPMAFLQSGVLSDIKRQVATVTHDQQETVGKFGGLGAMMRIMKDPDVQAGMWMMMHVAGKIGASLHLRDKSSQ
jgi:uncharacterized protein YjgD (DUF1641 family)